MARDTYDRSEDCTSTPIAGVITDTHLKPENVDLVVDIFKQFIELLNSLGLKTALHIGDWFTSRSSQSLVCLLVTTRILDMFEKEKIMLHIIAGNHDKTDLTSEESYLTIFNNRKYVRLYESEDFIDDEESQIRMGFLPYFKEGVEYLQRLSNLNEKMGDFAMSALFTHVSINGVRNNDGSVVEGDVEADFFNQYDLVFTGHYHNSSQVGENIHYIGSAYQANFGEDENKGFTILCDDLSFYHVQSNFPHYHKFVIQASDKKQTTKLLQEHFKSPDNVRFVFEGTQEEIEKIDVGVFAAAGISVQRENVSDKVMFEEVEDAQVMNFDKKTILKNYIEYTKIQEFTPEKRKQGISMVNSINFS